MIEIIDLQKSGFIVIILHYEKMFLFLSGQRVNGFELMMSLYLHEFNYHFRSEVFDMRHKSEPLISSRTHYWEIPPDVFGILTPSATSTILTGIGIALKLSYTITKVEEDYEGRSMFHSTSFRRKFNSMN